MITLQKVSSALIRCLSVLVCGFLVWTTLLFLPQGAEGLSVSYHQPVQLEPAADNSNRGPGSVQAVTIRVNGVPYTYYTWASETRPGALKPLPDTPAAPTGLKVAAVCDGRVDLTWNANSESNLKGYRVAFKPEGGSYRSFFTESTHCSVTGLKNGVTYTLKVKAQNTAGNFSTYSSHVYATPKSSPPATPTGLKVVATDSGRIDLTWNANREPDLKNYRLAYKPAGGSYQSIVTSDTRCSLTGLANGISYTLKVKAINTAGDESNYCSFVYATPERSAPADGGSVSKPPAATPGVKVETLAAGTKYATPLYIIRSNQPGPVVMIVGGVHGNEEAGYEAARKISKYTVSRGTLLVIPEANRLAIQANRRYASGETDLNRAFPQSSGSTPKTVLARAIYDAVKQYDVDWLMDLHEGYDYYKNKDTDSVGQTLIYYPASSTQSTAESIVAGLNQDISSSYRQFSLLRYPVKGSLARAAGEHLGVHSMIFETCDNPSLSTRVNYQTQAVKILLDKLDMR